MDVTADLAQAITWAGSKQTYYTARLMIDRDLMDDFFRAYAYLRWVDDVVDGTASDDVLSRFDDDCVSFVERQGTLIDKLYRNERPDDLTPEEEIVAVLVSHDSGENSGLQSFIRNMFAVIRFDALRRGRLISQRELAWYTSCLARSVTDGLQYFIGNGHPYAAADNRYLAATAAHIAHLLRDMVQDTTAGYVHIPREYLEAHDIDPDDFGSSPFRAWVRGGWCRRDSTLGRANDIWTTWPSCAAGLWDTGTGRVLRASWTLSSATATGSVLHTMSDIGSLPGSTWRGRVFPRLSSI